MRSRVAEAFSDRERRLDNAWVIIGALVAGLSLWLGAGYAVQGGGATQAPGWQVLTNVLPGKLHTHGVIMFVLGLALAVQLHAEYSRVTLWVLRLLRTYSMAVAVSFVCSWPLYGMSWGAPAWWLLLALLTVWLSTFAPDLHDGSGDGA